VSESFNVHHIGLFWYFESFNHFCSKFKENNPPKINANNPFIIHEIWLHPLMLLGPFSIFNALLHWWTKVLGQIRIFLVFSLLIPPSPYLQCWALTFWGEEGGVSLESTLRSLLGAKSIIFILDVLILGCIPSTFDQRCSFYSNGPRISP